MGSMQCPQCGAFFPDRGGKRFCSRQCQTRARSNKPPLLTRTHFVIPDTQTGPDRDLRYLSWINQYALDRYAMKQLTVVHLGDHWTMDSLSSYDRGKGRMEGRRVEKDIRSGNDGMTLLSAGWTEQPGWDLHLLRGNHEDRISRAIEQNIQLDGLLSLDRLESPGWDTHSFLERVWLDGVAYSHYFYNPNTGRPYAGANIETRLKTIGHTFTMGHQQGLSLGMRYVGGKQQLGLVAGSCYLHDEDYLGPQGNDHWRGVIICNNVREGQYDILTVGLDYLCRRYEGISLPEYQAQATV